ncbi:MAG: glycosyl hydrolase 53 family protein [Lachnospiraceae bacterium]|nr:glycosyl hydrolase 53 family protein [Lachnospiraceae bacterium]
MKFYKGVDISSLLEMEDNETKFYTSDGVECEALELCKKNGVNSIRLRIWNDPSSVPEAGGYCDLGHTVKLAKRIKENNLHFLLDFHYSDWWADPGKQRKPRAWEQLDKDALVQAVYDYTKKVLERLQDEGCLPDMVQIGNEIRSGMLFPDGEVPNYAQLAKLVNAGIQAARDVDSNIKVMIHLDQGGKYYYLREWFDAMLEAGLQKFDVIGISFYAFWHGTFTDLKNSMEALVERYKLPVIVVETAHPWRSSDDGFITADQEKIAGFPAGIEEQRTVMRLLMNIVASVTNEMGCGVYYWEPLVLPMECQGSWGRNMGVLSLDGKALPGFAEFKFERSDLCAEEIVKIYHPHDIMAAKGTQVVMPELVEVLRYDGERDEYQVRWDEVSTKTCGVFEVKGYIDAIEQETHMIIEVVEELPQYVNLVRNADFSKGESEWMVIKKQEYIQTEINQEEEYLQVSSNQNFDFYLCQDVQIQEKGRYALSVLYRGTNTTDVKVRLYGEQVAGDTKVKVEKNIYPTDDDWIQYEITDIALNVGCFTVGIEMKTPPVMGKIKGFTLYKMD